MSINPVQNNQQVAEVEAVSNEQAAHKRASQQSALPQDKVTIFRDGTSETNRVGYRCGW
jgi:hypothetical protein